MALDRYEDGLCPCGCGYPAEVSQDPENEDRFRAGLPIRCHARTALVVAQKAQEGTEVPAPEALLWESPTLQSVGDQQQEPDKDDNQRDWE